MELYICFLYYALTVCTGATFDLSFEPGPHSCRPQPFGMVQISRFQVAIRQSGSCVSDTLPVVSLGASPILLCLQLFIFWFYEKLACHMIGEK